MRRLLSLCLCVLCAAMMVAQTDLYVDGQLVARGVSRTTTMPEALLQLMQGRSLTQRPSARSAPSAVMTATIGPLLSSIRDQEEPYNLLCPIWLQEDGTPTTQRCLSGCVATAIEQVMAYYRYPEALLDTLHGWTAERFAVDDMLPGTRFDWDNYLLDYRDGWTEAQGLAIALPSLAAGMAVHMNYGPHASGANVSVGVEPLQRAFGYGMVKYCERMLYTPERWHAMLRHELEQGRPIVYTGHTMAMNGHAFNIDGIDGVGFYHVLRPDDEGLEMGFFSNQSAMFMHPSADAKPLAPDTMKLDEMKVVLERIDFDRTPDVQGYIGADFHFRNDDVETITYTAEETDFTLWYNGEVVATMGGEDVSAKIQTSGSVNTNQMGFYKLNYIVVNEDGFSASATRTVAVVNPNSFIEFKKIFQITSHTFVGY